MNSPKVDCNDPFLADLSQMADEMVLKLQKGLPLEPEGVESYPTEDFNLEGILPVMHEEALRAARRGDPLGIFCCADSNNSLYLLGQNFDWFWQNDLFEKALLEAWVNQKCVPRGYQWQMKEHLAVSSRESLMKHSDPLPDGEEFTVYRGVQKGDPRGVSWSLDLSVARSFASWFGSGGTLYKTVVKRSDVYAYVDCSGRREKEVLLVLDDDHPIEVVDVIEEKP